MVDQDAARPREDDDPVGQRDSFTMTLTHHPAAEAYRQRVLRERGWLRGVDYVLMRESVRAHDATDRTLSTRLVAERIQLLPAPDEAPTPNARLPNEAGGRHRKALE